MTFPYKPGLELGFPRKEMAGTETVYGRRHRRAFADIDIETGKGLAVVDACRKLGTSQQAYCASLKVGLRHSRVDRTQVHVSLSFIVNDVRPKRGSSC